MADRKDLVRMIGGDNRRKNPFEGLEAQIQAEYMMAWKHQKPEKDMAELRLKLYNNQKRDKDAVGDTTMFATLQTVLAGLYDDKFHTEFEGKEEGDVDAADNITALAESDYTYMEKDILDYEWDFDTCFFGRGLVNMEEFLREPDKNIFLPRPYVIDPVPFLRDPYCTSVNGDATGRGAARFFGWESNMTKKDMKDDDAIFDDVDFKELSYSSSTMSLLNDVIQARNDAQGFQSEVEINKEAKKMGANSQYAITVWYTHFENEKTGEVMRLKVWLANDRARVVGLKEIKTDYWQIVDRPLFPHSHDWRGTSIPDLTEDKQRARAVAQNLGLRAMKADMYPNYVYDSNKITNRKDLGVGFNKFIPVDAKGEPIGNAIMPMIKARPNLQLVDWIHNALDLSAQKATATPDIQQGIQSEKDRPLGETNLIASRVDTRYSLAAKVFGWSEKRFWRQWYNLYKDNFADKIDEKVIRIVGAFGPEWRPLMKEDITTEHFDPDIKITSKNVKRIEQIQERRDLSVYLGQAFTEPTANKKWGLRKLARLNGLKKDEIERLFPPTVDERIAEKENVLLNEDKMVPVQAEDNHLEHLEVHSMANLTNATKAHIATHERALSIKKVRPELFPQDQPQVDENGQPIQPGQGGGQNPFNPTQPGQSPAQALLQ